MSEPMIRLKNLKTLEKTYNLELQALKKELNTLLESQNFLNNEIKDLDDQLLSENEKSRRDKSIPYGFDVYFKHVSHKKEQYQALLSELTQEIQAIEDKIHLAFQEMQKYKTMAESAIQEMRDHQDRHETMFLDKVAQGRRYETEI